MFVELKDMLTLKSLHAVAYQKAKRREVRVNTALPKITSGLSLLHVVGAISENFNLFSTILSMFVFRSSSIRRIRFSSLVSSAFEFLCTNSILINNNVTRVKEVTEIATEILLIFSQGLTWTLFLASISVLVVF